MAHEYLEVTDSNEAEDLTSIVVNRDLHGASLHKSTAHIYQGGETEISFKNLSFTVQAIGAGAGHSMTLYAIYLNEWQNLDTLPWNSPLIKLRQAILTTNGAATVKNTISFDTRFAWVGLYGVCANGCYANLNCSNNCGPWVLPPRISSLSIEDPHRVKVEIPGVLNYGIQFEGISKYTDKVKFRIGCDNKHISWIQYKLKKHSATAWPENWTLISPGTSVFTMPGPSTEGNKTGVLLISGLSAGTEYDIKMAIVNISGSRRCIRTNFTTKKKKPTLGNGTKLSAPTTISKLEGVKLSVECSSNIYILKYEVGWKVNGSKKFIATFYKQFSGTKTCSFDIDLYDIYVNGNIGDGDVFEGIIGGGNGPTSCYNKTFYIKVKVQTDVASHHLFTDEKQLSYTLPNIATCTSGYPKNMYTGDSVFQLGKNNPSGEGNKITVYLNGEATPWLTYSDDSGRKDNHVFSHAIDPGNVIGADDLWQYGYGYGRFRNISTHPTDTANHNKIPIKVVLTTIANFSGRNYDKTYDAICHLNGNVYCASTIRPGTRNVAPMKVFYRAKGETGIRKGVFWAGSGGSWKRGRRC